MYWIRKDGSWYLPVLADSGGWSVSEVTDPVEFTQAQGLEAAVKYRTKYRQVINSRLAPNKMQ